MFENPIVLLTTAIIASAIPVIIWLSVFFTKKEKSKKTIALIFLLGCFTAPALLGIQYLWNIHPEFNLANFINTSVHNQSLNFALTFMLFGGMEEVIKLYVIKGVDEKTTLINNLNDAVKYSIVSALGFSFVENAYYLYQLWPQLSLGQLAGVHIFRSIFTTCAHMIFSGIFGYYYGIGKYSIVMTHHQKLINKISPISKWIANTFRIPLSEGFRQKTVLKGLTIAILMHAAFNYLLQFNRTLPVIIFVVLGYLFLKYLLSRKAGHLILTHDITAKAKSTIPKKDKEVVIELLGMWFQEEKYVDVMHICERLLERDPDNRVVQLFRAKAIDQMEEGHSYKKILHKMFKTQNKMSEYDKNIITKYTKEKEEFRKAQKMIKKQLEKEGKTFQENKTSNKPTQNSPTENFTGDGTFKL